MEIRSFPKKQLTIATCRCRSRRARGITGVDRLLMETTRASWTTRRGIAKSCSTILAHGDELDRAGQRDSWTSRRSASTPCAGRRSRRGRGRGEFYEKVLHDPRCAIRAATSSRRPAGLPTATRFVNSLLKSGITVLKASARSRWPQVLSRAHTSSRPPSPSPDGARHVRAQDHRITPCIRRSADRAYDIAGWTLAMQMA